MNTYHDKSKENKNQSVSPESSNAESSESLFEYEDNRAIAVAQRKHQEMADSSIKTGQTAQLQSMADDLFDPQAALQRKENNTGLPDNLKTGMESLSGISLDDVKVHQNSDRPAQLMAHAFAQGTDIHLGPGQDRHLPHEAWHVVQQKQGRVKPTTQMMGKANINDDARLEQEADLMGAKALQMKVRPSIPDIRSEQTNTVIQRVPGLDVTGLTGAEGAEKFEAEEGSLLEQFAEGSEVLGSGFEPAEKGMAGYKDGTVKDGKLKSVGKVESDGFDQASSISSGVTSVLKLMDDFVKLYNAEDKWKNLSESGLVEDVATTAGAIAGIVKAFSGEGEEGGDATLAANITDTISKSFTLIKQAYHLVKDPIEAQQTETNKWWGDKQKILETGKQVFAAAGTAAGIAKNAYEMASGVVPSALATTIPVIDIIFRTTDLIIKIHQYYSSKGQIEDDTARSADVRGTLDGMFGKDKIDSLMRDYPAGNYGIPLIKDHYVRPKIALIKQIHRIDKEIEGGTAPSSALETDEMDLLKIVANGDKNLFNRKYVLFSEYIREYELADKLTEINTKRKVGAYQAIFKDFLHVTADILTLTVSPASLGGLIIKTGLSAVETLQGGAEYAQDMYRENSKDDEVIEHSKKGKLARGADHARTIVGMYVKAGSVENPDKSNLIKKANAYLESVGLNLELLNQDPVDKRAEKMTAAFAEKNI